MSPSGAAETHDCPSCAGPLRTGVRGPMGPPLTYANESFVEDSWACDICTYVAVTRRHWNGPGFDLDAYAPAPNGPPATPDEHQLLESVRVFVDRWRHTMLLSDTDAATSWESLRGRLHAARFHADQVRERLGNEGPRPRPTVETEFLQLGKRWGYLEV